MPRRLGSLHRRALKGRFCSLFFLDPPQSAGDTERMLDYADGPELDLVRFEDIRGVEIRYARAPVSSYGSPGVPRAVRLDREFLETLTRCLDELWRVAPGGRAAAVVSAGCYVDKPGAHGTGRAIDIDAIWWNVPPKRPPIDPDVSTETPLAELEGAPGTPPDPVLPKGPPPIVTLDYPRDSRRYLAVEAILRKHFGLVLDFHYNKAHRDHWHIDDSQPVGFYSSRSRVVFVQAALSTLWGLQVEIDGKWGMITDGAAKKITAQLHSRKDLTSLEGWFEFLDAVAATGFGLSLPGLPA